MSENDKQITEIRQELRVRKYFGIIPYLVNDLPLSVYAKALYIHIVRRCGDSENGRCFETTQNMAKRLQVSSGAITKAKRELENAGFISISKNPGHHGEFPNDVITIIDITVENHFFYSPRYLTQEDRDKNLQKYGKDLLFVIQNNLKQDGILGGDSKVGT